MFQGDAQLHGVENQLLSEDVPVASPEPSSRYARPWPSASIVIVNTNELHHLRKCLPSLARQQYPNSEILVVDNASTDGSIEYVTSEFPRIRWVQNAANLGYAAANNAGFRHARGDYVVVLNPDTMVEPDWLCELVAEMEVHPEVGLATPKILIMDNPDRINACGNEISFTGLTSCRGLNQPASNFQQAETVSAISGAAFIIKRSVLDQIGGFDEDFFIYYEDTDLSLRAMLAGYTCLFVPTSIVYHKYAFRFSPRKGYYQERNRYYSLLRTLRWRTLLVLLPNLLIAELLAWGYSVLKGPEHFRSKARSDIWVLRNFGRIRASRSAIQSSRKVNDRVLLNRFSHRLSFAQTVHPVIARPLEAVISAIILVFGRLGRSLVSW
jgi:GT2 family glycosyltransferase